MGLPETFGKLLQRCEIDKIENPSKGEEEEKQSCCGRFALYLPSYSEASSDNGDASDNARGSYRSDRHGKHGYGDINVTKHSGGVCLQVKLNN